MSEIEKKLLFDQELEELSDGHYVLMNCSVRKLTGEVHVELQGNCVVNEAYVKDRDSRGQFQNLPDVREVQTATIKRCAAIMVLRGNAVVDKMREDSAVFLIHRRGEVRKMFDHSSVLSMKEGAIVREMYNESFIVEMSGESSVLSMKDDSKVRVIYENATVSV